MAAKFSLAEDELSCPVCCDIFREPVVLRCSHSFCRACLTQYWAQGGQVQRECPLCRRQAPPEEEPVPSLVLKNLCDGYLQESEDWGQTAADGGGGAPRCSLHSEPFKLFCLKDRVPMCVVCHSSRAHRHHESRPIGEATQECKEELREALGDLQAKWEASDKVKQTCEKEAIHIKSQVQHTEALIKQEFEKLHAFLQAEEAARMATLRKEGEEKTGRINERIEEMSRNMSSLSDSIAAIETELCAEDLAFLHNYKETKKRAQAVIQTPEMCPGVLVNVASHLGSLGYRVWEKMLSIVQYIPVTLDPNSAAPWLVLSDDLSKVRDSQDRQQLPDNPERFDPDAGVLGAHGFSSGAHWWDVEVGDSTSWVVGVAKDLVRRKEKVSSILKNGYLTVFYYQKMYFAGTSPLTRLVPRQKPRVIRVQLDCDRGRVTFSDPSDNAHIYTFKHAITEIVYPYLWVGCERVPLRILPAEVSVVPAQPSNAKTWF